MFRCDWCSKVSQPGEPMRRIVSKSRKKVYTIPSGEVMGVGTEIVSEIALCPRCAEIPIQGGLAGTKPSTSRPLVTSA